MSKRKPDFTKAKVIAIRDIDADHQLRVTVERLRDKAMRGEDFLILNVVAPRFIGYRLAEDTLAALSTQRNDA